MRSFAFALAFVAFVAGCDQQQAARTVLARNASPGDANAGRLVAEQRCGACHGLAGTAAAETVPRLAGQREAYLVRALDEYAAHLRPHAGPAEVMANLAAFDRRNVAAYYAHAAASRADVSSVIASPQLPAVATCQECHGADGNSRTPGVPSLAGQHASYLLVQLHRYQSGERVSPTTPAMAKHREEADLKAMSAFFASQPATPPRGAASAAAVESGRSASSTCTTCHGMDGASEDGLVPNLAGQDERYLIDAIAQYRAKGGHWGMQHQVIPLSDKETRDVAAFFAAQSPASTRAGAASRIAREQCDRCHDDGNASLPTPDLRGQQQAYLATALRDYRDGTRAHSAMHKMLADYDSAVIDQIARQYAAMSPNGTQR